MDSRRILELAVAGATLAAGIAYAAPASAAVTYDPQGKTGYVDQADVRKAFGWSAATLNAKAAGLIFNHDFWTDDHYAVNCGKKAYPVVHHREFGRFELSDTVVRSSGRGPRIGYSGVRAVAGFRLAGPRAGISGTSVAPRVGDPCPREKGTRITKVAVASTTTGWSLSAGSGEISRILVRSPQAG
jgi:hypothetical protein